MCDSPVTNIKLMCVFSVFQYFDISQLLFCSVHYDEKLFMEKEKNEERSYLWRSKNKSVHR